MDSDLAALAAAQTAFLTEALDGPSAFGPPRPAHWDAAHIVAHLLVNETLLLAVTAALAAGEQPDYDNAPGQDAFVLDTAILESRHFSGLVAALGAAFEQGRAAFAKLTAAQREAHVPVRIWHEGTRIVDEPLSWWQLAVVTSAEFHLPAHLAQLRALRS